MDLHFSVRTTHCSYLPNPLCTKKPQTKTKPQTQHTTFGIAVGLCLVDYVVLFPQGCSGNVSFDSKDRAVLKRLKNRVRIRIICKGMAENEEKGTCCNRMCEN